ncbi:cytochrome P450 2K4-like [Conger conger]|uniref:cytochrome P450 2K4-like n=1 Tax=Conger conger TaxID=82655 RepID=UPI002A59AD35|nr:cytochrome P450 2K4-like [Conger conger]XP_061099688.1 cytochrome P450 2K4-like [Conger conger]XP_061099689.1 cytochrome P450 2K4-like [Conger conger]XP_061099690.1 cytochrome P450 2K4-like [Conger conger]
MVVWELVPWTPRVLLLLGVLLLLLLLLCLWSSAPGFPKCPPGPRPLPLLGNLLHLDLKRFNTSIYELSRTHGSVFTLHFGPKRIVILAGYKTVKEALLNSEFDKNPPRICRDVFQGHGVLFANGSSWKAMKRFCLSSLRGCGMGLRRGELMITEECHHLIQTLTEFKGEPFDTRLLNPSVSNIICSMLFGHRFDYADPVFREMIHLFNESLQLASSAEISLYNMFPWLSWCCGALLKNRARILKNKEQFTERLRDMVERMKASFDPLDCRGVVDRFLVRQLQEADQTQSHFHSSNLLCTISDLFLAGTETTAVILSWGLILMAKYPAIQDRVQEELGRVVGQRSPRFQDQKDLPYTNAVIHEIQRFGSPVTTAFRKASCDVTFQGYFIEKGTVMFLSLMSAMRDQGEWETPHSFNPAHFLEDDGRFTRREALILFSAGHRACPGENLARMELFLIFTFLLQRFRFSPPPGLSEEDLDLTPDLSFTHKPCSRRLCAEPRPDPRPVLHPQALLCAEPRPDPRPVLHPQALLTPALCRAST